ncbi:hypothetical protein B0O80DRAFT_465977 [Mortierella sp. GBAus27b]|nr:hypothetical protein BGX31_007841 [Mortierella sp. GBA43]KAI8347301.1 hypothetical protein B0O80DRAFT_465977 [Mortierella sp. GBAus27b]
MSSAQGRVLSLPELAELIAINLRHAHLAQLRLTSKAFHNAFSPYYGLALHRLYFRKGGVPLDAVVNCGHMVKSLVVDAIDDQEDLYDALNHCRAVQRADLRYWARHGALIDKVLVTQLRLRDLALTFNGESANILQDVLQTISERAPSLERFKLDVRSRPVSMVHWDLICSLACPSLRHLIFRGFRVLYDNTNTVKQLLHIQSLSVDDGFLGHADIAFLLCAMPNLRTLDLRLYKTAESVFNMIQNHRMLHLTTLVIDAHTAHHSRMCEFIATCPRIRNFELRQGCQRVQRGDMLKLMSHFTQSGIHLERLAIDYEPTSYTEDWIRSLLEYHCPRLQELRLSSGLHFLNEIPEYLMRNGRYPLRQFWIPFAATLTTLHLESKYVYPPPYVSHYEINRMLKSLPLLVDLAIMDPIQNLSFLDGLGCVRSETKMEDQLAGNMPPLTSSASTAQDQDWSTERPFLESLRLCLADDTVFDAAEWNMQVVNRFRFLERFSVRTKVPFVQLKMIDEWQETLRPGLEFSLE